MEHFISNSRGKFGGRNNKRHFNLVINWPATARRIAELEFMLLCLKQAGKNKKVSIVAASPQSTATKNVNSKNFGTNFSAEIKSAEPTSFPENEMRFWGRKGGKIFR